MSLSLAANDELVAVEPDDVAGDLDQWLAEVRLAVGYRGLELHEVRFVILAGAPSSAQLAAISEVLTGLRGVLIVDAVTPDRDRLARHPPSWSGMMTDRDALFIDLAACADDIERARVLVDVMLDRSFEFEFGVCVGLDGSSDAAARDWLVGHGTSFFEAVADRPLEDPLVDFAWLTRLADAAFAQRQYLIALQAYLAAYRRQSRPAIARQLAATWHALECPRRAIEWIGRAELPEHLRATIVGQLEREAELVGESERELELGNADHLERHFPELAAALLQVEAVPSDVAWLRSVPWILGSETPDRLVERQDYPVLLRASDYHVIAVNLPGSPRAVRDAIDAVDNAVTAHALVGSVTALDALLNTLRNPVGSHSPNWEQQVYVVEADLGALRRLMQVCDLSRLLVANRITFEWGLGAEQRMVRRFKEHAPWCLPAIRLALSPALASGLDEVASVRLRNTYLAIDRIAESHHRSRIEATLAKLERGEPLRVWAMTSIRTTVLQYVLRDLLEALRELGHTCELLIEAHPGEYVGNLIATSVAAFDPDVLIMVDHVRAQVPTVLPPTLPSMTLILDELPSLVEPKTIAHLGPFDLAFPWSHALAAAYLDRGYPHAACLPFAASEARYASVPGRSAEDAVAFATHVDVLYDHDFAPGLLAALERRFRELPEVPRGMVWTRAVIEWLRECKRITFPEARRAEVEYQALLLTRVIDRMQIAEAVIEAGLPIRLYGRGWEQRERFVPHHRGIVAPGEALRDLYVTHKVVLHINQNCNVHPRVLEAMCAGGFVLARDDGHHDDPNAPDWVGHQFELGRELCLFTDRADMVAKIRRAFDDEPWRQRMIAAGQARVRRDHTYRARAIAMLAELERRLRAGLDDARSPEAAPSSAGGE